MNQYNNHKFLGHRDVWSLAWPIIVSGVSTPLVGIVDTAVVGHLPEPQSIGAVALGALIFSFLFWGFGFLKMGTTGFIAQAYGSQDNKLLANTLSRVTLIAIGFGILVIFCSYPLIQLALYVIDSSPEIESLTADYAYIRIWSAPATLSTYVFTAVFIGMQNTRKVLLLLLVLNFSNILLDLFFVIVFDMGVEGVALATLLAEYMAAACGVYLLRLELQSAIKQFCWHTVFERTAMIRLMKANGDIFIRTLCLVFSISYFTAQSAKIGELTLAANAILLHFQSIMAHGLDGFAHAAEALTGRAYGAKKKERFKRAVKLTTIWAFVVSLLISALYFVFGEMIISVLTNIEEVKSVAIQYLPWMIIAPIVSVWSFQLDGVFIGTSQTKAMRNAMIISVLCYLTLLQIFLPLWGNHGLFLGLSVFMLMRAVTLLYYYPKILRSI